LEKKKIELEQCLGVGCCLHHRAASGEGGIGKEEEEEEEGFKQTI